MNMKYAMRSEDTEQINVVSWANWNMNRYPELRWLFHVPNGGSRNKQEAVKFKQMQIFEVEYLQDREKESCGCKFLKESICKQRKNKLRMYILAN